MALVDYGPSNTAHVENGPCWMRPIYYYKTPALMCVGNQLIFICFQSISTCNCFHTFHNEIMHNICIIMRRCWYIYIIQTCLHEILIYYTKIYVVCRLLCGLLHVIQIVISFSTIRKVTWSSCQNIRTCAKLSLTIQGGHYP